MFDSDSLIAFAVVVAGVIVALAANKFLGITSKTPNWRDVRKMKKAA